MAEVAFKGFPSNSKSVVPVKPAAPDLLSYLAIYGTRIHAGNYFNPGGVVNTIYVCPAGKTFFLTSAQISCASMDAPAAGNAISPQIILYRGASVGFTEIVSCHMALGTSGSNSAAFPIPMRVIPGEQIMQAAAVFAAATGMGYASISGYEIDTALLNSIL